MSDSSYPKWGRRLLALALAALLCVTAASPMAVEVDTGAVYCFQSSDFPTGSSAELTGICITGLPQSGIVRIGRRQIVPGDILTAEQVNNMTFHPTTDLAQEAQITYLPICENRVEKEAVMTISIRKTENQAPVAENGSLETYKNIANTGTLQVTDPEGSALTFTVVKAPKRGEVTINADGTFTYTPKKNKVGKDVFTFTATDEAGAVSNEATITIEILKPLDSTTYKDVNTSQFEALWMRNTGLFAGTQVAGSDCFGPEETVTRGDFLAMVMKLLEIPVEESLTASGFADEEEAAAWLRPYLAAAMRLGIVSGSREKGQVVFRPNDPITGAEAAVMLQNVLLLPKGAASPEVPTWAQDAVSAMAEGGITLTTGTLTRLETAQVLYQVSKLSDTAPGLEVFRQNG